MCNAVDLIPMALFSALFQTILYERSNPVCDLMGGWARRFIEVDHTERK